MVLRGGFLVVAQKLQEAATAMCHADIYSRLSDTLNDSFRGSGYWGYIVAVFGDDQSGDVIYSTSSDLKKASYTISGANCTINFATAVDVQPLTTYEIESTDVSEAGARNSKRDMAQIQTIHDATSALGANCSLDESVLRRGVSGRANVSEVALNNHRDEHELLEPHIPSRAAVEASRGATASLQQHGHVLSGHKSKSISLVSEGFALSPRDKSNNPVVDEALNEGIQGLARQNGSGSVSREIPQEHSIRLILEETTPITAGANV